MHSPSAMMTLRPRSAVFIASFSVVTIVATRVGAHLAQPLHAHGAQRLLDAHAGRRAFIVGRARRHVLLAGRRRVAVLHHDQHAVALVEQVRRHAGDQAVMPEAAVAHHRDRPLVEIRADRRRRWRATCRSRGSNCPSMNGAKVANEWQPISALIWVGPISRCISLIAENTGRSGQPVQKVGGRGGNAPSAAAACAFCATHRVRLGRQCFGIDAGRLCCREEVAQALEQHVGRVFAGLRQHVLAVHAGLQIGAAQLDVDRLLDVVRDSLPRRSAPRACRRRSS